jgi:hypothetical protein
MSPTPPPDIPSDIEEELTGGHRRAEAPAQPAAQPLVDSAGMMSIGNGIKVPAWVGILMFLFGSGTGAVGGGAVDVFGLKAMRSEISNLETKLETLRADLIEAKHKQDLDILRCGCQQP